MRYLIAFFKRYSTFFLFLILEIIALFWILNKQAYQRSVFASGTTAITGSVFNTVYGVSGYFNLLKDNNKLMVENANLRKQLIEVEKSIIRYDTLFSKQDVISSDSTQYSFIPAYIICNSVNKANNFFMIDVGEKDGVTSEMGVIGPNGVIGIIVNTSKNYSWVMSLLHGRCRISARLKKNNMLGTIKWDGVDYRKGTLIDIPSYIDINKGDTLVASGFSHMFPRGTDIGIITDYRINSGDDMYTITFEYLEDLKKLNNVYVVINKSQKEQVKLKTETKIYE